MRGHDRSSFGHSAMVFAGGVVAAIVALALVGGAATRAAVRYDDLALFASVLDLVRRNYVEPVDEHDLMESALHGLLHELDPHSAFMSADAYEEMQVDTRGEFHGLGIEITKAPDGFVEVVSPIDGTPAFRAGVKPRDQITAICPTEVPEEWADGETCRSTQDMSLVEAVTLMRGRKGTDITIDIFREGFEQPRPFTIRRDVVQVVSAEGRMVEPGYGLLRVRAFQERTSDEAIAALKALHEEAPTGLRGLVLDLRDNPGGLLNQAVSISDLWLSDGLIVYTQGREESQRQDYHARAVAAESDYPMVVLVNGGSASASEIVAGALQDHERALVIGTSTFGKGSVQTVYPLEGGAGLRLTTALYYTPSGRSIQEVGIEPDIEVLPVPEVTVARDRRVRERDLRGHFTHERAEPGDPDVESVDEDLPPAPEEGSDETTAVPQPSDDATDPVLERALDVLKSWTYFERLREKQRADAPVTASAAGAAKTGTPATPGGAGPIE